MDKDTSKTPVIGAEVEQAIRNGELVKLTAKDDDINYGPSNSVTGQIRQKFDMRYFNFNIDTSIPERGCRLDLFIGPLPKERREEMVKLIKSSSLAFSRKPNE